MSGGDVRGRSGPQQNDDLQLFALRDEGLCPGVCPGRQFRTSFGGGYAHGVSLQHQENRPSLLQSLLRYLRVKRVKSMHYMVKT